MGLQLDGRISAGNDLLDTDLRDIHIISGAGGRFLYASTGQNGGISVYSLNTSGGLASLSDSSYFATSGMTMGSFDVVDFDGALRLVLGGTGNGALIGYGVDPDGDLAGSVQTDLPGTGVETARAVASGALGNGLTGLYMVDGDTGALRGFVSNGAGALTGMAGLGGAASAYDFSGAAMLETTQIGGNSYLVAGDGGGSGVHSYLIDATTGALTHRDSLGAMDGLGIAAPSAMQVITAHGATWVVLAASGSGSLSVMQLAPDGQLSPADHVLDTLATRFGGVAALEVIEAQGHVFVLAGGADDGLSLFSLLPDGQLVHMQSLAHSAGQGAGTGLENITGIEAVQMGDEIKIFVTSGSAPGVSQFSLSLSDLGSVIEAPDTQGSVLGTVLGTGAGDLILGRGALDQLMGQGGDDILVASGAGGVLTGGAGADIFVLCPTAGNLEISDFQSGLDRLDLSHFPMLRSLAQLDFTTTATGIEIRHGTTVIQVHSNNAQPLLPADLWPDGFDTPDRVPIPPGPVIRFTYGTAGGDILDFGAGQDRIWGLAGNDDISSGAGRDRLFGGNGADILFGGPGLDRLKGGVGPDTLKGGDGKDTLEGGMGRDILRGGNGPDTLQGNQHADTLTGGAGADMLTGGTGADRFIFDTGHGADRISDFTPNVDHIRIKIAGTEFADLILTAQGDDTVIDTGSGTITLTGVSPGDLSPGDFLFF